MFKKNFSKVILLASMILSLNIYAADNTYMTTTSPSNSINYVDPANSGSTYTTSTSTTTKTPGNMSAADDADANSTEPNKVGIFTITSGQKCIPSCEGTYVLNGQSFNALLFLKDARTALLITPYNARDSLNYKQLIGLKNMISGNWRPKDDGTIEFKAVAIGSNTPTSTKSSKSRRWSSSRGYNNSNDGYYDYNY